MEHTQNIEETNKINLKPLFEKIEQLAAKAALGDYQSSIHFQAIEKLADSNLNFTHTTLERILNKGRRVKRTVKNGERLYHMMRRLLHLVKPIGKGNGTACTVRLIKYEKMTKEEFLRIRTSITLGFFQSALNVLESEKFNAFDVLSPDEKELYHRLKPYFGKNKKPTLQSLAKNLLDEEGIKGFSERNLYYSLEAVKDYHRNQKQQRRGISVFSYTVFSPVERFGVRERTLQESIDEMKKTMAKALSTMVSISDMKVKIADLMPNISKELNVNYSQIIKDIVGLQTPKFISDMEGLQIQVQKISTSALFGSWNPYQNILSSIADSMRQYNEAMFESFSTIIKFSESIEANSRALRGGIQED